MRRTALLFLLVAMAVSAAPAGAASVTPPDARRVFRARVVTGAYELVLDAWTSEPGGTLAEKGVSAAKPTSQACVTLRRGRSVEHSCGPASIASDHHLLMTDIGYAFRDPRTKGRIDVAVTLYADGTQGVTHGGGATPTMPSLGRAGAHATYGVTVSRPAVVEATARSSRLGGFSLAEGTGTVGRVVTAGAAA